MPLNVVATHEQLVAAINAFPKSYHDDYFGVRKLADKYIASPSSDNTVSSLATELRAVLCRWGAGQRGAPTVLPVPGIRETLNDQATHTLLSKIVAAPLSKLSLSDGATRTINGIGTAVACGEFDSDLHNVLVLLAGRVLYRNTNVTYPTKALLLITGLMPALDSQVRKGLHNAGVPGVGGTQFKMPPNMTCNEARKLSRLPFLLADCYIHYATLLRGAVAKSNYPGLNTEVGRLFDVLLFMQGSADTTIFSLIPPVRGWYRQLA